MSLLRTAGLLGSLVASASAHGYVSGIIINGEYQPGYNPSFQYQSLPPTGAGWSDPENLSNGYVAPAAFSDPDIICHLDATPGGTSAKITAGDSIDLQWTVWPDSHHGPVIDYLAKCAGDCSDVDKTTLKFFKISEGGLIDGSSAPGKWASDDLIANNNTWSVKIPTSIAPGNYVLRHEIIALHSAGDANGAQNYPQCINLEVTSDGTDAPSGTLGTALYKEDDPGIKINIYTALETYTIPGPALYSGAGSGGAKTDAPSASSTAAAASGTSSYVDASTTATAVSSSSSSAPVYGSITLTYSDYASSTTTFTAAPSSTNEVDAGSPTSSCTTTVYETVTATETAIATAAPYSAIASIVSAVPSEALTSTIPTALPSGAPSPSGGHGNGTYHWGDVPSKPLPAGYTLKDLLEWVAYLLKKSWSEKKRVHQRDFGSFAAAML